MKKHRRCQLGGGERRRERGGVEGREGGETAREERPAEINRALRTAGREAWKRGFPALNARLASC